MRIYDFEERPKNPSDYKAVKIGIASPEKIREWSYGEVKKPETINYRNFKPEKDGLFSAQIFGPIKDYECLCGKYKRYKYKGVVCEKCGVEVTTSKVRRERMGHIELAAPVAHIWYLKSIPSKIGSLLNLKSTELERVLYFEDYIVLDPGDTDLKKGQVLSEREFNEAKKEYMDRFRVGMGAEAIRKLLEELDMEKLSQELREALHGTSSESKRKKIVKRLRIVEAFKNSGNRPEWMILTVIPVIPPDLRPLVPLEGGRFATSDLNDLYRRVINRNNRLKKLIELNAPEIIIRNEKRMLQEAVDALFDNGRRGRPIMGSNRRPLKSLSQLLSGKKGRFRQNLLGKRVDYSGRSVIVVGPELRLHQCGLPKIMAMELFKPFVYAKLQEKGSVSTIKAAKKKVERGDPEVWEALEEVIREHPVMLNRAPTLHRLSIQAFEPVLVEDKAIHLHPLVCTAFNADFDGDQMAVHIPLSLEAQAEARVLMMSTNNILKPASGEPIIYPTQDIVLGIYYMTRERPSQKGEGMAFSSPEELMIAYENGEVSLHAKVKVKIDGELYETTTGRVIFYEIVPREISFDEVNKNLKKKDLANLIDLSYRRAGEKATVIFADRMMAMGYDFSTRAGISIAVKDMKIPSKKWEMVKEAEKEVRDILKQYEIGAISEGEKHNRTIDVWRKATEQVRAEMMKEIRKEVVEGSDGKEVTTESFNSIYIMADSGARGSSDQMKQLAGMRGLMMKPSGDIIETPILANFREGLSVLQYFISTHGARKGLADTALKTANSGYLTRRLVDVAQDIIVTEYDCGTLDGIEITPLYENGEIVEHLKDRILGRVAAEDIVHPDTGEILVYRNQEITEERAQMVEDAGIESVMIRSVITCKAKRGVCALCYGRDLARGRLVNLGEAVGVIAAQSIGEPGTQLTMRTFHTGGAATSGRIEQSLQESKFGGKLKLQDVVTVKNREGQLVIINRSGYLVITDEKGEREKEKFPGVYGAILYYEDGETVPRGARISEWDPYNNPIVSETSGIIKYEDVVEQVSLQETIDERTGKTTKMVVKPKDPSLKPRAIIVDKNGSILKTPRGQDAVYDLPIGALLIADENSEIHAGETIAKIPRESSKATDITGGLPRVVELFEARKPQNYAIISEIDGVVHRGQDLKGKVEIIIEPEIGKPKKYLIPSGKHIIVQEGDFVRAGDQLVEGAPDPHTLLKVKGEKELAKYLVAQIQEVYRNQGVKINDKHIEVIVRQMLRKVKIVDPGDTTFLPDENVLKYVFEEENRKVIAQGKRHAKGEPVLLGITRAALTTDSWISAASFQETTRVLTDASISGRVDYLHGLKENVIMGRLIPAGTGFPKYHKLSMKVMIEKEDEEEIEKEGIESKLGGDDTPNNPEVK